MLDPMTLQDVQRAPRTRPLYRREYEALAAQGYLVDEDVELLDGQICLLAEEGPPHAGVNSQLNRLLVEAIPADEGEVRVGSPLAISDLSLPHPDFAVVAPRVGYHAAHPTTASLVIEVADSSRRTDLGLKAVLYAAAGLTDYWVVDLIRQEIVVHREPTGTSFGSITRHREGLGTALRHPGVVLDVRDFLGRP